MTRDTSNLSARRAVVGYKIRRREHGGGSSLSLPKEMVDLIPPNSRFVPELVDEGILFRLVRHDELPAWARANR